ncbi:YceD family protein [Lactobacillus hamsteri]|uniref:Nucleic acid-binding protein n=1 Tax=Lactobacillus hamsteri DSM 5661 = JCM 6256 TaxID=1423754 RepID=A0A0R1Y828_9LACO|nr:YceD family protein [Lactobacillus hamsteri]KRM37957.1 nucleic acid-binding protein [Lactobacillus hamsteri DSM 5661 = JCM 6256]
MLSISYLKIKNSNAPLTHIDRDVEVRPEFLERGKDLLYKVKNIHVSGDFFYDEPYVTGNFKVTADLEVPSSRSLKPVDYHEEFTFTENYSLENPTKDEIDENPDPIVKVEDDLIDLQTAVEDNILLNIPVTILTEDEKKNDIYPEGKGWEVVSEKSFEEGKKNQINPAFAKLKVLLDNDDKK